MKYKLLALLTDRPDDIDWTALGDLQHPAVRWIRDYYDTYGSLPSLELFAQECLDDGEPPISTAPWSYYVKEAADLKFVQEATKYLDAFNRNYANDPKLAILSLRDSFAKLSEPQSRFSVADIAEQTKERWEHFSLKRAPRIKIGIQPFDDASGGISPDDEFMVLAARLGSGKSFWAQYMALEMAKQGLNVGIYSGEMSEYEVGARIDTWLTHISNYELTRGKLSNSAAQEEAYANEVKGKILVVTPKHLGHNATPSDLRKFVKEFGLSVLIIDQLSLMLPDGRQSAEMHQKFASLSLQLKSLQQELRIPFIAISQLNRAAVEQEINATNIAGSDQIGQDATIVLALEKKDDSNEISVKVLKARSFKRPKKGWTFSWEIDTGVLTPILTAFDSIAAAGSAAKSQDKMAAAQVAPEPEPEPENVNEDFG